MAAQQETSALFSLSELMRLEQNRIAEEEEQRKARVMAEEDARRESERLAREQERVRLKLEEAGVAKRPNESVSTPPASRPSVREKSSAHGSRPSNAPGSRLLRRSNSTSKGSPRYRPMLERRGFRASFAGPSVFRLCSSWARSPCTSVGFAPRLAAKFAASNR